MIDINPLGDLAILIFFGDRINETIHKEIQQFISKLNDVKINGIVEWVPTYNTIAIYYRPEIISYNCLVGKLEEVYSTSGSVEQGQPIVYEIPVYYGGETGPDLSYVAQNHGLSEDEVIALHSGKEYLIYMMGFVPGFPYLGGLSSRLVVPRLEHPRPSVPAGAVGIGGNQTGIYPSKVPSGWRILGITPVKLFDIENPSPVLLSAGDYIKFFSIDFNEYSRIKKLVAEKKYKIKTHRRGEK